HSLAPKSEEGPGCEEVGSDGVVCCCGTGAFASSGTCAWVSGSVVKASPPREQMPKYGGSLVHGVPDRQGRGWAAPPRGPRRAPGPDGKGPGVPPRAPRCPPASDGKERGSPPLHQHTSSTSGAPADPTPASPARRRTRRTG